DQSDLQVDLGLTHPPDREVRRAFIGNKLSNPITSSVIDHPGPLLEWGHLHLGKNPDRFQLLADTRFPLSLTTGECFCPKIVSHFFEASATSISMGSTIFGASTKLASGVSTDEWRKHQPWRIHPTSGIHLA
ncbi:unnamed protein product, partial [Dovyalis caffra]